jgi:hypothetical protein
MIGQKLARETRRPTMGQHIPGYVKGAKFVNETEKPQEWVFPREPGEYSPTNKFVDRYNQLRGIIEGENIADAIMTGRLYSAAKGCHAFVLDLNGVALYIVVAADYTGPRTFAGYEDLKKVNGVNHEDFEHSTITLWPYVYNRDKAWGEGGWPSKDLDKIQQIEPDIPEDV